MKINRIIFEKLKLKWEILKYGAIEVYIQTVVDSTIDDHMQKDVFGNAKYHERDMLMERMVNIKRKRPILLENEQYEELARLQKIYQILLDKYKKYE